jgi:hypothetical protein
MKEIITHNQGHRVALLWVSFTRNICKSKRPTIPFRPVTFLSSNAEEPIPYKSLNAERLVGRKIDPDTLRDVKH